MKREREDLELLLNDADREDEHGRSPVERELGALFNQTMEEPSDVALARMMARAALIPEVAPSSWRQRLAKALSPRQWAPALVYMVALMALGAWWTIPPGSFDLNSASGEHELARDGEDLASAGSMEPNGLAGGSNKGSQADLSQAELSQAELSQANARDAGAMDDDGLAFFDSFGSLNTLEEGSYDSGEEELDALFMPAHLNASEADAAIWAKVYESLLVSE